MVTADAQLQLRWHSHTSTFTSMLADLHNAANFSDVVLSCQGGHVEAHRAILSLCSPYLGECQVAIAPNIMLAQYSCLWYEYFKFKVL